VFSNPDKIIEQFGITEGAHVADFGCGSGFYTLAVARKVGSDGKVYAIDVNQGILSRIAKDASEEGIENLEVVWGDIESKEGSRLKENSIDVVIVSNVLFQVDSNSSVFVEAYRVLRPGGRVLVIDWHSSSGGAGPKEDSIVTENTARGVLEEVGFSKLTTVDAGDHHYGISAKKPKS